MICLLKGISILSSKYRELLDNNSDLDNQCCFKAIIFEIQKVSRLKEMYENSVRALLPWLLDRFSCLPFI